MKKRRRYGLGSNTVSDDKILRALDEEIDRLADMDGAMGWSIIGDLMEDDLKKAGFDSWHGIAMFGDVLAVDGEVVVSPQWMQHLYNEAEREALIGVRLLWGETTSRLYAYLRSEDFKQTTFGGEIPSDEQEVSLEFAIDFVVGALDVEEDRVKNIAKSQGYGSEIYISTSGETEIWAKKNNFPGKYLSPL